MKFCPSCKAEYSDSQFVCQQDNIRLSFPDPYGLVGDDSRNLIDGRYRLDRVIAAGGMAVIYYALQVSLDRPVALKMPLPQHIADQKLMEIFEREAKNVGSLYHNNIVIIHDRGRDKNRTPYIVMEWIEGNTLEHKMLKPQQSPTDDLTTGPETTPLSLAYTSGILRQIATALDAAHVKNIIHRDIKPSNILLVRDGLGREQIKVVDFGIAKIITDPKSYTTVTTLIGTSCYASPEQWQLGAKIDHTSDIYSLGVMLYQMLAGRLPFYHADVLELVRKHSEEDPPKISKIRPDAIVVEEILLKMLAKAQHERPKKPLEIADRFETAIAPIEIEGQVVWEVGPANKIEPISGAIIRLHQGEVTQLVTDENGSFIFKRVINAPPFKISVQADYFESGDYEIKSGQLNPVTLTPRTAELSGRVLTQVGDNIRPRELSHVNLKLEPLNITTATDGEGRFKFRLIGPQLDYLDTACKVYIEGYSLSRMLLMTSEMAIVVTPNNSIQVQEPQQCPKCNKIYADHKILKFCYKCGTDLRK